LIYLQIPKAQFMYVHPKFSNPTKHFTCILNTISVYAKKKKNIPGFSESDCESH